MSVPHCNFFVQISCHDSRIVKHEPDAFDVELQRVSRALFKRQYRLAVLICVALTTDGAVYARDVARRLGVADNQVSPDFQALRAIGALQLVDTADREVWHQRLDHPIWAFARTVAEDLARKYSGDHLEAVLTRFRRADDTPPGSDATVSRTVSRTQQN